MISAFEDQCRRPILTAWGATAIKLGAVSAKVLGPPRPEDIEVLVSGSHPVHVLDDDSSVRRGLKRLLNAHGWTVQTYATASEFEQSGALDAPGCLLLDLRMPDGSGLELLARLEQSNVALGVLLMSAYGDVPSTVRAMRLGALDFLTKPISEDRLLDAVQQATARSVEQWQRRAESRDVQERLARLTPRERQVSSWVARGLLNKQIAFELGTSEKTIKVHRARAMAKLEVGSVAELVRLLDRAAGSGRPRRRVGEGEVDSLPSG
jgi:RNA polymerase sigma factor (sigma-70 family)